MGNFAAQESDAASAPELSPKDLESVHTHAQNLVTSARDALVRDAEYKHTIEYHFERDQLGADSANHQAAVLATGQIARELYDTRYETLSLDASIGGQQGKAFEKALWEDPSVQKILPELSLLKLEEKYEDIHDKLKPGGITRDELRSYADRDDLRTESSKVVMQYVMDHFDRFKQLDPDGGDKITQAGIENGLKQFAEPEIEIKALQFAPSIAQKLAYLNDHFDDIHKDTEFKGISQHELDLYLNKPGAPDDKDQSWWNLVNWGNDFKKVTKFDTSDGDRLGYTLWLAHGNAPGITRQDIAAGLKEAQVNLPRIAAIRAKVDSQLDDWQK